MKSFGFLVIATIGLLATPAFARMDNEYNYFFGGAQDAAMRSQPSDYLDDPYLYDLRMKHYDRKMEVVKILPSNCFKNAFYDWSDDENILANAQYRKDLFTRLQSLKRNVPIDETGAQRQILFLERRLTLATSTELDLEYVRKELENWERQFTGSPRLRHMRDHFYTRLYLQETGQY